MLKIARLWLIFAVGVSGLASIGMAQSSQQPKTDVSLAESKKISPFPPKSVTVQITDGRAILKWTKVPSEKITGYDIYRVLDDGKLEKLGHTKELTFVDKRPPNGKTAYAVASVDYNDNRSKPREASVEASQ